MDNDTNATKNINELLLSFKNRLPINKFNLEDECQNQCVLYNEVSQLASDFKSEARKAKEKHDYIFNKVQFDIRKNPTNYGIDKITESVITTVATINEEVINAKQEWLMAEEVASAFITLVNSVEQRKSMLRDLVQLFVFGYYNNYNTKPVGTDNLGEALEKVIRERNRELNKEEKA